MRILAVDDDPTVLDLVRTTLRCAGYAEVATAPHALGALTEIARAPVPFDCFLLDIRMPGTDGIELCRQIRRIEAHRDSPVLMITAATDRDAMERAFAAGATDYVGKPFDPMELVVRIGVAERICGDGARIRAGRGETEPLRRRAGRRAGRPDLDAAFDIEGVPSLVGAVEMENYLLRMPRLRAWRSRSYVLRVEGIDRIHAALSGEAFHDLMAEVGEAVDAALRPWPHVLTYAGAGAFAAVVHGPYKPKPEALLEEVRAQVRARGLVTDAGVLDLFVDADAPVGTLLASLAQRSLAARH